jgi:hypothetical protein
LKGVQKVKVERFRVQPHFQGVAIDNLSRDDNIQGQMIVKVRW